MIKIDNISFRGLDFKIVRDDLFPEIGGGNKARKALEYESDALAKGANALITTGGIQSNHCRAIAILCARRGWKCKIVYHGTRERFESEKGNALIVRMCGAETEFVGESEISSTMDNAMRDFRSRGFSPYYVRGGGHDICGGMAYVKAVAELASSGFSAPDYIFHASGTGSTQAGIFVGLEKAGWKNTKVVGISVARNKERGTRVISEFSEKLAEHCGADFDSSKIIFTDKYVCGGYEKYPPELESFVASAARETGILFDTTYSGKALYGMFKYIAENNLSAARILFWHTGGIFNIMA